jgi:hypothetical protein
MGAEALEDLATHGTRHDCNPTVMWPTSEVHAWWVQRAHSMDKSVRDRARRALAALDAARPAAETLPSCPDCGMELEPGEQHVYWEDAGCCPADTKEEAT